MFSFIEGFYFELNHDSLCDSSALTRSTFAVHSNTYTHNDLHIMILEYSYWKLRVSKAKIIKKRTVGADYQ